MDDDKFNMELRKFLKEVGVTSQRELERAVAAANKTSGTFKVKMHLTSPDIELDHVVERDITLG